MATKQILNDILDALVMLLTMIRVPDACGRRLSDEIDLEYKISDIRFAIEEMKGE